MAVMKDKVLRPVHANAGLEAEYRKSLDRLIDAMHRSLIYWLRAAYRKNEPETTIAQDASPAATLNAIMKRLSRHWLRKFTKAAPELAKYYATKGMDLTDKSLERILKDSGVVVKFKLTAPANDVLQATVSQNVSLIKSIAQQHLTDVEGSMMRAVQTGGDIGGLVKDLEKSYGVTKRRAKIIARDQVTKANAALTRVRQSEAGITKAVWMHSSAGKEPRPSHVAMNGQEYDIAKGMWDPNADGKGKGRYVHPGELINCRCVSRAIIPALNQ